MGPKTESDLLPEGSFGNDHMIRDQMAKHRFRKVVFTQLHSCGAKHTASCNC